MSAISNEAVKQELALLDDIELNENDLTEQAKTRFPFHTDVLNAFDAYRCRILSDQNLTSISRHSFLSDLIGHYTKGKQVLNYMAQNSELLSHNLPTIGPIVICGLPRTGTTLLYNLLACDPHCRAPLFTDMYVQPVPPIVRSNTIEQERRVEMMKPTKTRSTEKKDDAENDFQSIHPFYGIEEDSLILFQAGCDIGQFVKIVNDHTDFSVCLSNEMKKDFAYDYHEIFLRMLNSVDAPSSHWLLKAPAHLLQLGTLLRHYPNAVLIMTHRNMNETLPSFYKLLFSLERLNLMEVNSPSARKTLIAQYTQLFDKMVECLIQFRSQSSKKNTFDVIYDDLMDQPISTVRHIYDYFGLKWSDEFEKGMESWLRDNPQGKRGRHTYSLAEFALKQEDIDTRYGDYIKLFLRSSSSEHIGYSQSSSTNK